MNNLADRCEAASGADRAIDYDIAHLTGDHLRNGGKAPAYTASIDAALTLVPEGASWQMRWWSGDKKCWLTFYPPGDAEDDYFHVWEAATPALALCAAALRAKEI